MGQAVTWQQLRLGIQRRLRRYGYDALTRFPVDPFRLAALEGIEVVKLPLGHLGGVLLRDGELARVLLAAEQPARWTFTLAHELIHLWFHPAGVYYESLDGATGEYEVQANHGAAMLIMPAWAVREVAGAAQFDASRLAHAFGVSRHSMEIRLEELRLVP